MLIMYASFSFHESHSNYTFEVLLQLNPAYTPTVMDSVPDCHMEIDDGIGNLSRSLKTPSSCTLFPHIAPLSTSVLIKQALYQKCFRARGSSTKVLFSTAVASASRADSASSIVVHEIRDNTQKTASGLAN